MKNKRSLAMQQALRSLGAGSGVISQEEKQQLDEDGFLRLDDFIPADIVNALRRRTDKLIAIEGDQAGDELLTSKNIKHPKELGATRLANLVNKGPEFETLFTHPKILSAVDHVIVSDFKLSSMNYRAALPGAGEQNLHADWKTPVNADDFRVCNSIWLLDDFTPENGATRLVPKSHLFEQVPADAMSDPSLQHPEEVLLEAKAGTVVIFNAHLWHGGTTNRTNKPRRAIHSYFCRRDQPQQLNQQEFIQAETLERLSSAARFLLDVS